MSVDELDGVDKAFTLGRGSDGGAFIPDKTPGSIPATVFACCCPDIFSLNVDCGDPVYFFALDRRRDPNVEPDGMSARDDGLGLP